MDNEFFKNLAEQSQEYENSISGIKNNKHIHSWEILRISLIGDSKPNEAIELSKIYVRKENKSSKSLLFLGQTYEYLGQPKLAIKTYESAIKINAKGSMAPLFYHYSVLSEKYYDKEKILEIYAAAIKKQSYLPIYKSYIEYLLNNGENKLAEKISIKGLTKYKNKYSFFLLSLTDSYINQHKYKKAKRTINKLISKNPNHVESWKRLSSIEKKIANSDDNEQNITRTIEFKPEYHTSGIAILQNFGKLLRDKYDGVPVKVTITQEDLMVKMVIVPPDGEKLEIEEYLYKYGLVVKGEMRPEELLTNPLQISDLKTELKLANMRIELNRDQMQFLHTEYSSRIMSLEEDIKWLRTQIGNSLSVHNDNFGQLLELFNNSNNKLTKTHRKLIKALEGRKPENLESLLIKLKNEDSSGYTQLKNFVSNAITSTGANAPAWIEMLSKVLPS